MHDLIDSLKRSKKGGPKFFFHFTVFDRVTGIVHKFFAIFFLEDEKILNFGFNSIFPFFLEENFTGAAFLWDQNMMIKFYPGCPHFMSRNFSRNFCFEFKKMELTNITLRTFFWNFRWKSRFLLKFRFFTLLPKFVRPAFVY